MQLSAVLLLLVTQWMAVVHAADQLTHENTELCELFEAFEHHDGQVGIELVNLLPLALRDDHTKSLPEYFQPVPEQHYLSRAPPAI